MSSPRRALAAVLLLLLLAARATAQPPRDNGVPQPAALQAAEPLVVQPASATEKARATAACTSFFRAYNGVCTNPVFKLWGSTGRAQSSLFLRHSSERPTGARLPSARLVSNKLCAQSADVFNARGLNELVVFFGQFVDHTLVATPVGDQRMNIPIPRDDPIFANFSRGQLQFRRSRRADVDLLGVYGSLRGTAASIPSLVQQQPALLQHAPAVSPQTLSAAEKQPRALPDVAPTSLQQLTRQALAAAAAAAPAAAAPPPWAAHRVSKAQRPINSLTSALDLASVYGADAARARALRAFRDGKLKVSRGRLLPLNTARLSNAPTSGADFFLAGDHRANEHPALTALHTVFVREHNAICDEVRRHLRVADDALLFELARMINVAQFQKIVFEEFFPAVVGRALRPYSGFKPWRNVAVLDVFSTAAFRVGHTMVGNRVSRAGRGNRALRALPLRDMFFRRAAQFGAPEAFLRGAAATRAQEVDVLVHDALRNFLFSGVPEEGAAFDLVALNVQRGRDHALPPLNAIRARLGLRRHRSFFDITRSGGVAAALSSVYGGDVDKVEAWVGMVAEDHVPGSSLGATMAAVWTRQFENLRDGDRFYYRNYRLPAWLRALPRVRRLSSRRSCLRDILVRNTDIAYSELNRRVFFTSKRRRGA